MLCLKKGWARVTILKLMGTFIFQLQDAEEPCPHVNGDMSDQK